MSNLQNEQKALSRLCDAMARDQLDCLTKEEIVVLRNVIEVYRGLMALGWLGRITRNSILLATTLAAAYLALSGAVTEWLRRTTAE